MNALRTASLTAWASAGPARLRVRRQAIDSGTPEQRRGRRRARRVAAGTGSAFDTGRCHSPHSTDTRTADARPRGLAVVVHVGVERSPEGDLLEQERRGEVKGGVLGERRHDRAPTDSGVPGTRGAARSRPPRNRWHRRRWAGRPSAANYEPSRCADANAAQTAPAVAARYQPTLAQSLGCTGPGRRRSARHAGQRRRRGRPAAVEREPARAGGEQLTERTPPDENLERRS